MQQLSQFWIISGCLYLTLGYNVRNLMLLKRGDGNTFRGLWDTAAPFNDPVGNKSLESNQELYAGGDFRALIDPAWGFPSMIEISSYNELRDPLFLVSLDVTGRNLSNLDDWLLSSPLLYTNPVNLDVSLLNISMPEDSTELLIKDTSDLAWFSIQHGNNAVDPLFVLAVNTSSGFTVIPGETTDEGCLPDWYFNFGASYVDAVSLTPQACLAFCSPDLAATQSGTTCNCGTTANPTGSLSHMCTITCPGDANYLCGGINVAYFQTYSGTVAQNELENISANTSSGHLYTKQHFGGSSYTINITQNLAQSDNFLYIDAISVLAYNLSEHIMLFTFSYSYYPEEGHWDYIANGKQFWETDGAVVDLYTLFVREIIIYYEWEVLNSTIKLFGPTSSSYVGLDYILVTGYFDPTTSTTAATTTMSTSTTDASTTTMSTSTTDASTTTMSTSTTDASTTTMSTSTTDGSTTPTHTTASTSTGTHSTTADVASTTDPTSTSAYNVLINGTLYCPCNETINTTSSVETNETFNFDKILADMTLDPYSLSLNQRKYFSAEDNRPSAISIGSVALAVILSVIGIIIYLDSARLVYEMRKIKKHCKRLKRQISKRSVNRVNSESSSVQGSVDLEDLDIPDILK